MSKNDIASLFDEWNLALQTKDPKKVAALYDNDAIFLPTLSSKVHRSPEEFEEYFEFFIGRGPSGKINEQNIRIFDTLAINSGVYTFTLSDNTSVPARFTFVYRWNGKRWLILEHHSSQMPEQQ